MVLQTIKFEFLIWTMGGQPQTILQTIFNYRRCLNFSHILTRENSEGDFLYDYQKDGDGQGNLNFDAVNTYSIVRGVLDMYEYAEKLHSKNAAGIDKTLRKIFIRN